jgi:hypothetical protein
VIQLVEIRIILSETEYEKALQVKGALRWRDVLLNALGLKSENRRRRGRPKKSRGKME